MGRKITALFYLLALLLPLAALTGCGDTNVLKSLSSESSDETKMEEGIAALDSGDYNGAVAKLSSLPDSDDKRKYLASAYMGLAGFDTLDLIAAIDDARDNSSGDASVFWDAAGAIFEDDSLRDGLLSLPTLADKKAYLENALGVLMAGDPDADYTSGFEKTMALEGVDPAILAAMDELTDARAFQTGIAALLHTLISVAEQVETGGEGVVNPAAYLAQYGGSLPELIAVPPALVEDLTLLFIAVDRVSPTGQGNLLDDFNQLLIDIGYADDHVVTLTELQNFLDNLNPNT